MDKRNWLWIGVIVVLIANGLLLVRNNKDLPEREPEIVDGRTEIDQPDDINPRILNIVPDRELTFEEVNKWVDKWHKAAPEITEVGVVGQHKEHDIKYIRVGNKTGPKVLIIATIHGNEKLCTMTMLGVFGKMLDAYGEDAKVTKLLQERDIYFVPIVSPEGFINNSRHVMGLDPNRNFNGPRLSRKDSIPCVNALKKFHQKHHFNAVMSCHDYGRIYFYPWGYVNKPTQIDSEYKQLLAQMARLNGYQVDQIYHHSAPPYYGYEVDWFYRHGAVTIVNEIGTRFEARKAEIDKEVQDNFRSTLLFIEKAPLIKVGRLGK